jgi:predicted nucleic acid-binding protein
VIAVDTNILVYAHREHCVKELWSADRDFGRFPNLAVVNPLVV